MLFLRWELHTKVEGCFVATKAHIAHGYIPIMRYLEPWVRANVHLHPFFFGQNKGFSGCLLDSCDSFIRYAVAGGVQEVPCAV